MFNLILQILRAKRKLLPKSICLLQCNNFITFFIRNPVYIMSSLKLGCFVALRSVIFRLCDNVAWTLPALLELLFEVFKIPFLPMLFVREGSNILMRVSKQDFQNLSKGFYDFSSWFRLDLWFAFMIFICKNIQPFKALQSFWIQTLSPLYKVTFVILTCQQDLVFFLLYIHPWNLAEHSTNNNTDQKRRKDVGKTESIMTKIYILLSRLSVKKVCHKLFSRFD